MKKAFTLAEVLITLTIIGVIAALTIPNLMRKYEKEQTIIKLKKAYSEINNVVHMSIAENGATSNWPVVADEEIIEKYFIQHFKNVKVEDGTMRDLKQTNITANQYVGLNSEYAMNFTPINPNTRGKLITFPDKIQIFLPYIINGNYVNPGNITFAIDINGINNKPGIVGKDLFFAKIWRDLNKVTFYTYCDGDTEYKNRTLNQLKSGGCPAGRSSCNKNERGYWCGALIQQQGWQITKDYPW